MKWRLLLLMFLLPSLAFGQSEEDISEAKRLYQAGRKYFEEGHFREALSRMKAANALAPNAILLFNIALCSEKLDLPAEAIAAYEGYLKAQPDAQDRATVETWIANLRKKLMGTVALSTTPPGALVRSGGKELGRTPLSVQLPEGTHELQALLEGHRSHTWTVEVKRGETRKASATLVASTLPRGRLVLQVSQVGATVEVDGQVVGTAPLGKALDLSPGSHRVAARAAGYVLWEQEVEIASSREASLEINLMPLPSGKGATMRIAGWALVGLTGAAALTGSILGGLRHARVGEMEDMVGSEPWGSRGAELLDESNGFEIGAWLMVGTAVASAAASTTLLILGYRQEPASALGSKPGVPALAFSPR